MSEQQLKMQQDMLQMIQQQHKNQQRQQERLQQQQLQTMQSILTQQQQQSQAMLALFEKFATKKDPEQTGYWIVRKHSVVHGSPFGKNSSCNALWL